VKEYLKYFGVLYIIFLLILVIIGSVFISRLPDFVQDRLQLDTLMYPRDSVNLKADLPMVKGTISAPVDVFKLSVSTPELVEKGKGLFTTNCATCHGDLGTGDGVAGAMLNPKPRNFTSLEGWTNGPKFTQMYKTLQEGITNRGMASYANLPPEDRIALIHYIQQTFMKGFPSSSNEEIAEIDKTYSLMQGAKLPNQIPVKLAMEKILTEKSAMDVRIDSMVSAVKADKKDPGAVLLKDISANLRKAITVLARDTSWMNNENELVNLFVTNPVQNGFKAKAYSVSQQELSVLHAYVKNLFITIK